jgi:predicted dehydrogenase
MIMTEAQEKIRYAVIGAGAGVFSMHIPGLQLPTVELVALSDINPTIAQNRANEFNCAFYTDYCQMLKEVHPDVAVIITPHPLHARVAIDCLQAGSHVLVEKPMAVQVAEADAMIEAAQQQQRQLGVIFQQRFRPQIQLAHQLIQDGHLGQIQRVDMMATWMRTATYYRSAGWRGTWEGEGGGVLMNQAPHQLDQLCYLIGLPARVFAWTRHIIHQIETEDTVQAALEWPGGALGSFHISTAEADQGEYLKIVGTKGRIELIQGKLTCLELETDARTFIETHPKAMASPAAHEVPLTLPEVEGNHKTVYEHFNRAILQGIPFTSTGTEGRMSLELANALIYSNHIHSEVELPLPRQRYAELLASLRAHSIPS